MKRLTTQIEKSFKRVRDYYGDRGTFARGPEMLCIWKKQNFTFSF